jgi:hypothetical protein
MDESNTRINGKKPTRVPIDWERVQERQFPTKVPCQDPRHGSGYHWCPEVGGFTGGLKIKERKRP